MVFVGKDLVSESAERKYCLIEQHVPFSEPTMYVLCLARCLKKKKKYKMAVLKFSHILFSCCQAGQGRYPLPRLQPFVMKDASLPPHHTSDPPTPLSDWCLADKTSFRVHGVLSCPVMSRPTWTRYPAGHWDG